jgi:type I restriction enzyme S subunit
MSNKNKFEFKLRFPEFKGKETWADRKLSEVLFERKEKSTGKEEVFSVSVHKGVIDQIEHLGRSFAASNTENYKRVLPGDIIYTKSPTGDFPFGIIKQSKVSKPVIVSPLYGVFRPETIDLGVILDAYFEYPERTINYLSSIVQKGAKNTININNETFLSKSLVLPTDKFEQQKIASCLSSLDEVITGEQQKLELLKQHKKGLLQNLFPQEGETVPKLRFKEFENSGEWEVKKLGEVLEKNKEKNKDRKYTLVQSVSNKFGFINQNEYFENRIVASKDTSNYYVIRKGCFAYNPSRIDVGSLAYKNDENISIISPLYVSFKAKNDKVLDLYLLNWFRSNGFIEQMIFEGGVRNTLNFDNLIEISIPLPSLPEQEKIAACLSSLDEIITAQTQKIEQLQRHKKGLLQGLFPNMNEHHG